MSRGRTRCAKALVGLIALLAAGCTSTTGGSAQAAGDAVTQSPVPSQRPAEKQPMTQVNPEDFATWRSGFRQRALAQGISAATFDAAFTGVGVNARVLELDAYQPEFVRPIWEYLDSAVSAKRIADGQARVAEHSATLARIRDSYSVDEGVIAAIWGIESAYGYNYGSMSVIESLATLAYEGRRRDFAEEQLIAALRIIQNGDITAGRMVGSWAGAMGHTQFIPTSFATYAVDFTGDGRRDVWSDNPADALASTANYLAKFGWERGRPAVVEARLPQGFDYRLADDKTRKTPAEWQAMGVTPARGGSFPEASEATLLLPAGAQGPAFLAYPNFRVIKRYNNATSYALAVSLLGAYLDPTMRYGLTTGLDWPRGERPLTNAETQELQRRLTALGYPTQGIDGIVGPNTRDAIRAFQSSNGMTPDGYLSSALLTRVRAAGG